MHTRTKQSSHWGFPLKVWLLTVAAAPLVFILLLAVVRSATWSELRLSLRFIGPLFMFGFLLLLPMLLLYWLAFRAVRFRPITDNMKKLLLSVVGLAAIWLLYFLYDRSFFGEGGFGVYSWPLSYSMVLVIAGALCKLPAQERAVHKAKAVSP